MNNHLENVVLLFFTAETRRRREYLCVSASLRWKKKYNKTNSL